MFSDQALAGTLSRPACPDAVSAAKTAALLRPFLGIAKSAALHASSRLPRTPAPSFPLIYIPPLSQKLGEWFAPACVLLRAVCGVRHFPEKPAKFAGCARVPAGVRAPESDHMGLFWAHSANFSPWRGDSGPFGDASPEGCPISPLNRRPPNIRLRSQR
jgi:hypothetical protein